MEETAPRTRILDHTSHAWVLKPWFEASFSGVGPLASTVDSGMHAFQSSDENGVRGSRTHSHVDARALPTPIRDPRPHILLPDATSLGGRTARMWTVTLHPEEAGIHSKTRAFDCSLLVDNP